MLSSAFTAHLNQETATLKETGVFKTERLLTSPQGARIQVADGAKVINLCANNYLGLANHPDLVAAAHRALDQYGYGMSSVRFICGTTDLHRALEQRLAAFLGKEDVILYGSCFDANGGLFEALLGEQDAVISDALNHASIIDGIRLCKAKRYVYPNNNMSVLEEKLKEASSARFRLVVTDGVFSMDGTLAPLKKIVALAKQYDAMVCVDDSHAVGFMGEHGRGTHEHAGVMNDVDILTGTLGKALGGGLGGYTAGSKEIIAWLRQRSRPYLFSNSLPPLVVATAIAALDLLERDTHLREQLHENARYFRAGLEAAGFTIIPGEHPIIPVMLGEAKLAQAMSEALLARGVYVIGFFYPVVPHGQARIRTQVSAAHTRAELDEAIAAFKAVGQQLGVIS
ncbi:MAG: glycine C-acetyltransferase [Gammaproteobacteria bacterium]